MRRLIDANVCLHDMCKRCNIENEGCPCEPADCFIYNVLENSTTVDAVEVVRCKDCKWYQKSECRKTDGLMDVKVDDFCSYGERKEDGKE